MAKGKRIDIQTLERGQHEDLTRGDAFTMAATLEALRGLYDDRRWPMTFPGTVQRTNSTETPLRAHVLSGLLVRPDNNTYLLVDAGALLAAVPPASSDDSILELVNDPGVSDTGTLLFIANAAGSVRLDIVEVSVGDIALENVTRGIFNTGTRVFDPTPVDKVSAPQLSYRIRQGTAGAGLPALASGWLPLAVICHQPSTTSFADCDMWDVRPLVADLVQFGTLNLDPQGISESQFEQSVQGRWRSTSSNGLSGYAVSQFDGYLAGGQLRSSSAFPLADRGNFTESFSLTYAPNQDPAFALTANTILHVAACFPGGLPRWVKYVDSAIGYGLPARVPTGPRGILVVTNVQPKSSGYYSALPLPTVSGFTAAAPGVALLALAIDNAGTLATGIRADERVSFGANVLALLPGIAGVGTNQLSWTFTPISGAVIPAEAKRIDLEFTLASGTFGNLEIFVKRQTSEETIFDLFVPIAAAAATAKFTVRGIPLSCDLPWRADGGGLTDQTFIGLSGVAAFSAASARIVGYSA